MSIYGSSCYRDYEQQVAACAQATHACATPGKSRHGWGRAVDINGVKCGSKELEWLQANGPSMGIIHPYWALCPGEKSHTGQYTGQAESSNTEPWHWEMIWWGAGGPGGATSGNGAPANFNTAECPQWLMNGTVLDVNSPQALAQATYAMFLCKMLDFGLGQSPPDNGGNPTYDTSGFSSLADQIAAEAVVVGACESGYSYHNAVSNNSSGYGGVFQFGNSEIVKFGYLRTVEGKFNPHNNIFAATQYFLNGVGKNKWNGWGPWAPVNTDYGGGNVGVKLPAVPRFKSTRAGFVGQYSTAGLPAWALDPWSWQVLSGGSCSWAPGQVYGPATHL